MSGAYADALREERRRKDEGFARSPHSPLPAAERASFKGLRYFEPDERYRAAARWEPHAAPPVVRMQTSTGEARDYVAAGTLHFEVEGQAASLQGLLSLGGDAHELFVPFRDATSGKETYGAGRYLEVPVPRGGTVELDFNRAYNPFCAYSEDFSCPLPPLANWLKLPIRAGERTYKDD